MMIYLAIIIVFLLLIIAALSGLYLQTVWLLSRNNKPNNKHYASVNNYYIGTPETNSPKDGENELERSSIRHLKEAAIEICETAGRGVAAYRQTAGEKDSSTIALPMEVKSADN